MQGRTLVLAVVPMPHMAFCGAPVPQRGHLQGAILELDGRTRRCGAGSQPRDPLSKWAAERAGTGLTPRARVAPRSGHVSVAGLSPRARRADDRRRTHTLVGDRTGNRAVWPGAPQAVQVHQARSHVITCTPPVLEVRGGAYETKAKG